MNSRLFGGLCCFAAAVVLPIILITLGEVTIPTAFRDGVHQQLVMDSQAEVDEWIREDDGWVTNNSVTFVFYNLTNAKEMQTSTPAPKPAFEAISVECIESSQRFDGTSKDGGSAYEFHEWARYTLVNEADASLEIVNVNPIWIGLVFTLAPSETAAFAGLSDVVLGIVQDVMTNFGAGILALPSEPTQTALASAWAGSNISTAADFGIVQFASNIHMNLAATVPVAPPAGCAATSCVGSPYVSISASPAIQAAGVCTPLELNTYLNDLTSGPFTSGGSLATMLAGGGLTFVSFSMTYAEATAFFAVFTAKTGNFANGLVLGQMLVKYNTFLAAGESASAVATAASIFSTFGATFGTLTVSVAAAGGASMALCTSTADGGACPALAVAYATYLTSYLPEKFFVGCSLLGCAGTTCMKDDGTSPLNGGLFVRHTVREMLHGWDDPIFAAVPPSAFPPGTPSSYGGLLDKYASQERTLDDLRADITSGTYSMEGFGIELKSGGGNVEDTSVWIARQGVTSSVVGDSSYTGWGTSGRPGEPFNVTGLRSIKQSSPQAKTNSPFNMVGNYEAKPNFGSMIDVYLTQAARPISWNCGAEGTIAYSVDDCAFHDVKGIKTLKFIIDPRLYSTTLDGVSSSDCRGTASARHASFAPITSSSGPSCDWLMRHEGVLNLEVTRKVPTALTIGYLGHTQSGIREAVSITEAGSSTAEIYFGEAKDGVAVYYDPITGLAIKGREYLQANWYVEATLLDSQRYTNVFTADTDNDDSFVWPYVFVRRYVEITDDDASSLKEAYQTPFVIGLVLDVFGIVSFVMCFILGIICFLTMRGRKKDPADASLELKSSEV